MTVKEETVRKNYIYKGKIINVRCDDARQSTGRACKREMVEHPGGSGIFCMKDGKILFVRQFRYVYGEDLLEIPAGKLDVGENPADAAKRELEEETGMIAERVEHWFTLYPTPGYTNEHLYIYAAYGAKQGEAHPDEGEFLNIEYYTPEEALEMIQNGTIRDAKTIVAVQRYFLDTLMKK